MTSVEKGVKDWEKGEWMGQFVLKKPTWLINEIHPATPLFGTKRKQDVLWM